MSPRRIEKHDSQSPYSFINQISVHIQGPSQPLTRRVSASLKRRTEPSGSHPSQEQACQMYTGMLMPLIQTNHTHEAPPAPAQTQPSTHDQCPSPHLLPPTASPKSTPIHPPPPPMQTHYLSHHPPQNQDGTDSGKADRQAGKAEHASEARRPFFWQTNQTPDTTPTATKKARTEKKEEKRKRRWVGYE